MSFKEEEIAAADSEMYKDAMALALASGQGYSEINYNDYQPFEGMQEAIIKEDVPDTSALNFNF